MAGRASRSDEDARTCVTPQAHDGYMPADQVASDCRAAADKLVRFIKSLEIQVSDDEPTA